MNKTTLKKLGFVLDETLGEYIKNANENVREGWHRDRKILNSPEELEKYSWDNKVQFLNGKSRKAKLNWKQIRFIYDQKKKAILEIHTYNGFTISITQSEFKIYNIGIPKLEDNDIDTYYINGNMDFDSIDFYGNFDLIILRKDLQK